MVSLRCLWRQVADAQVVLEACVSVRELEVRVMVCPLDYLAACNLSLRRDDLNCRRIARHVLLDSYLHRGVVAILHHILYLVFLLLLLDVWSPRLLIANHELGLDIKQISLRVEAEGALALAI